MSLYYSARWIVEYESVFYLGDVVYPEALPLDYSLLVTKKIYWEESEEGYNIICFVLKVPSENDLQIFIDKISIKLGILSWQPTTEEEFSKGYNPPDVMYIPGLGDGFTRFFEMGRENQELRAKYANGFRLYKPGDYEMPWRD